MALRQIRAGVQRDGNYSLLDLADIDFGGRLLRIETMRCSHPDADFGTTLVGTNIVHLAGEDHLQPWSNRVFRHVFSRNEDLRQQVTLEFREEFDPSGGWDVLVRDLDPSSSSYGASVRVRIARDKQGVESLEYAHLESRATTPIGVFSPLEDRIDELTSLPDLASVRHEKAIVYKKSDKQPLQEFLDETRKHLVDLLSIQFIHNMKEYLEFGHFRDKCVHPGFNLIGPRPDIAAENMQIRSYRASMILLGAVFDGDMLQVNEDTEPTVHTKAGVYSPFLSAYVMGIRQWEYAIDKVHSDYGGIPMRRAPGSRLENGAVPVVDATLANITLTEAAVRFYLPRSPVAKAALAHLELRRKALAHGAPTHA